jgi:hypothetical protein
VEVRISRSLTVITLLVLMFFSANKSPAATRERRTATTRVEDPPHGTIGDAFLYDVVTRFNESLVGNIDAIDTAVTAVLAGNVAIMVFAIDKIRELHPVEERCAMLMLSGSVLACACAYVIGFPFGATERDGVLPSRFIPDFIARRNTAISAAIETVTEAGVKNVAIRSWKRALVVFAIVLLVAGVVVVMLARLGGK